MKTLENLKFQHHLTKNLLNDEF